MNASSDPPSAAPPSRSRRRASSRAETCSSDTGLVRKSRAPRCMARTATSTAPKAVNTMTSTGGVMLRAVESTAMPSTGSIFRSVKTMSGESARIASIAEPPSYMVVTWSPERRRSLVSASAELRLSSTTRMRSGTLLTVTL